MDQATIRNAIKNMKEKLEKINKKNNIQLNTVSDMLDKKTRAYSKNSNNVISLIGMLTCIADTANLLGFTIKTDENGSINVLDPFVEDIDSYESLV